MQESYPICIQSQIAKEGIKVKAKQNNKITFLPTRKLSSFSIY